MLDLKKYDATIINKHVEATESNIDLSANNKLALTQADKIVKVETNFEHEIKLIYDKQFIRDAIKDLFIKYDFSYDLKNIVELKILGFRNFQIAEKVGKGSQAVSNNLSRQDVKDFFNDLSALKVADNYEKISIGNTLAINKILELVNSKDERVALAAAKLMIELEKNKMNNNSHQNVSLPNNAVRLDLKKAGYLAE